jgi:hypothetical protein
MHSLAEIASSVIVRFYKVGDLCEIRFVVIVRVLCVIREWLCLMLVTLCGILRAYQI